MIRLLVSGVLIADPVQRTTNKGQPFATFTLRSDAALVNCIAFDLGAVEEVMRAHKGEMLSVAGKGELRSWTARNGAESHGLGCLVDRVLTVAKQERPRTRTERKAKTAPRDPEKSGHENPETARALAPWLPGGVADIPNDLEEVYR